MSLEGTPTLAHSSPELLGKIFRERLRVILHRELGVENIENFTETALAEIIGLNDEIMAEYMSNEEIEHKQITDKEHEDRAYQIFKLESIGETLKTIGDLRQEIDSLKKCILENKEIVDEVIIPSQQDHPARIQEGKGGGMGEKEILPRVLTFFYILKHDFNIEPTKQNTPQKVGTVYEDMVRRAPYERIDVPELNRVIYICEEEGNASFVFDTNKLTKCNIQLERLDECNKDDMNKIISDHPGIGVRLAQSIHWRDRISFALAEPIPETKNGDDDKKTRHNPKAELIVAKGELDPWRGFWMDENGKHWGSRKAILNKLKKTYTVLKNRPLDKLQTKIVGDLIDRPQIGYCFEQFVELYKELLREDTMKVETSGEWKGFWTDLKTGKHWASTARLQKKVGVNDWVTIAKYAKKGNLDSIKVEDLTGRTTKGYCYEDLLDVDDFVEFLTAPEVDESGKWAGFWTDNEGKHWGSPGTLANHFNSQSILITTNTVVRFAERRNLRNKNVKTLGKEINKAFCLEDLLSFKEFTDFLKRPKTENEGQWAGFLIEGDKHYGTILQISKRLSTYREKINSLIKDNPGIGKMDMKDSKGKPWTGYCIEEIEGIMKKYEN